jgi:hypothetical protein
MKAQYARSYKSVNKRGRERGPDGLRQRRRQRTFVAPR